jgi:hypothetical protein
MFDTYNVTTILALAIVLIIGFLIGTAGLMRLRRVIRQLSESVYSAAKLTKDALTMANDAISILQETNRLLIAHPTWVRADKEKPPTEAGWYRVLLPGDSESDGDGHTIYDFGDYEDWAYFDPDNLDPDNDNPDTGDGFSPDNGEAYGLIAYCGPFHVSTYAAHIENLRKEKTE